MDTKKKNRFQATLYVYMDDRYEKTTMPIACSVPDEAVDKNNPVRKVGIYQLIRVTTVRSSVKIDE